MEVVTLWLAVDDSLPENGCMRVVPGTQHMELHEMQPNHDTPNVLSSQMDPDLVDPSKPNIGKLWEPDEEAARRIKAHRPDSADSIHSVDLGE